MRHLCHFNKRQLCGEILLLYNRTCWHARRLSYSTEVTWLSGGTRFKSRAVENPCSSRYSMLPWYCEVSTPATTPSQGLYVTVAYFTDPSICISSSNSALLSAGYRRKAVLLNGLTQNSVVENLSNSHKSLYVFKSDTKKSLIGGISKSITKWSEDFWGQVLRVEGGFYLGLPGFAGHLPLGWAFLCCICFSQLLLWFWTICRNTK